MLPLQCFPLQGFTPELSEQCFGDQIRILFGLSKMTEYKYKQYSVFKKKSEYKYYYSASTIRILFEYQNIRSQAHTHIHPRQPPTLLLLNFTLVKYIIVDFWSIFLVFFLIFFFSAEYKQCLEKNPQQILIRILFGLRKSAEYEYEYQYSASTIQMIFEYRIIRSPLDGTRWDITIK